MTGAGSVGERMTELPTDHDCYDAADHYDIPATTGRNSCIWYCTRCGATLQVGRQAHPDETDDDLMAAAGASWQGPHPPNLRREPSNDDTRPERSSAEGDSRRVRRSVKASAYASHVCAWSVRCGQRPTATFDGKRYCDHHHEQVVRRSRATTRDR